MPAAQLMIENSRQTSDPPLGHARDFLDGHPLGWVVIDVEMGRLHHLEIELVVLHLVLSEVLRLDGRRDEAVAAVPDELVRAISLIGPAGYVAERVEAFRQAGVTTLAVTPLARDSAERVRLMAGFRRLVG